MTDQELTGGVVVTVDFGTNTVPKYSDFNDLKDAIEGVLDCFGYMPVAAVVGVLEIVKSSILERMQE